MEFWTITLKLLDGFKNTFYIFGLTLLIAIPLGLLISFGSMSKFKPLSWLMKIIVWIVRGIPLMLQVIIIYYGPGFWLGAPMSTRFTAVVIAFSINYACYFSEIFRGGIENISRSQFEAGQVLGMTKSQIFFRVILLQVIKRITAPMANEIITLVKDTALARVIAVVEIIKVAENIMHSSALLWPLFYTGVFYLAFIGILTLLFGYAEKKMEYFKV